MNLICLSKCKTVSWANSLAVNVAIMLSPLSILFINACIFWIWIFWSNTSSFGHELIFCCSLCIVYIGIRSSEPIDIWDNLEDFSDLQLRKISKEINSWVKFLSAGILEILTFNGYDNCDKIRPRVDVVTEMQQRKCVAIAWL